MDKTDNLIEFPVTVKVSEEAVEQLIDFMINWPDIFASGYIGYWGYPLRLFDAEGKKDGWLIVELDDMDCEPGPFTIEKIRTHYRTTGERKFSIKAKYKRGGGSNEVADREFLVTRLDREAAMKVIGAGIKRQGKDFVENYDAETLDVAIQEALLGDVVYG